MAAIGVGWLVGVIAPIDVVAATNSQVAGRVSPRLIDLVAALATGVVGAFAQCREDVSDTLPGVAIAISLVPPLVVIGLTLEAGALDQSLGALLLFSTNVAAILVTGCVVTALYGVFSHSDAAGAGSLNRRTAVVSVVLLMALIAVPLTISTLSRTRETIEERGVHTVVEDWADPAGWSVIAVGRHPDDQDSLVVTLLGPPPSPDVAVLRRMVADAGFGDIPVVIRLVGEDEVVLTRS